MYLLNFNTPRAIDITIRNEFCENMLHFLIYLPFLVKNQDWQLIIICTEIATYVEAKV